MSKRRVLVIGLDGFEWSVAKALMAEGALPHLAALRARSARFLLEHGKSAKRTGLAWEHVATGLSPDDAERFAAVSFDPRHYTVWQEGTSRAPFPAKLSAKTVVFDPPYFALPQAPQVQGLVGWGAHDPGVAAQSRPKALAQEIEARFGPYPAREWIYGLVWPSPERTKKMADALLRAIDTRARAARWLFAERLPEWDLGLVVVSELHSASESLWHGYDISHPLHGVASAAPARKGFIAAYHAVDRLIGTLTEAFPDATVVAFSAHGMGANDSDVPSMLLIAELLYRHHFGRPFMREPAAWREAAGDVPLLDEREHVNDALLRALPGAFASRLQGAAARRLAWALRAMGIEPPVALSPYAPGENRLSLDWMPAARYRRFWPRMKAFALPSFYDGRIRVNLKGRERQGLVSLARYDATCDEIESLLRECRNLRTGAPVVDGIERCGGKDPLQLGPTAADLIVAWQGAPLGFSHERLGRIGPVPYRRTGGHTGDHGVAFISGRSISAGDYGLGSTFDIVPTVIALLGEPRISPLSGKSLFEAVMQPA